MAKRQMDNTQKGDDEKESLEYWLQGDAKFKDVATELYVSSMREVADPIGLVAAFQNLHLELYDLRTKPGVALKTINERFAKDGFTFKEQALILQSLNMYFEPRLDNMGFPTRAPIDDALSKIRIVLRRELDSTLKQLKTSNKGKGGAKVEIRPKYRLARKSGAKVDMIRILNAMWGLRLIVKVDENGIEQSPTKEEFLIDFGNLIGEDFKKAHVAFSQAMNEQPLEVNLKIFHSMMDVISSSHHTNKPTKRGY